MTIRFVAMPTEEVAALQPGGPDAHGQAPERQISDGDGVPCRHCLTRVAKGEPYLILAYRPFPERPALRRDRPDLSARRTVPAFRRRGCDPGDPDRASGVRDARL